MGCCALDIISESMPGADLCSGGSACRDEARGFKFGVCSCDCPTGDTEVASQLSYRWKSLPCLKSAAANEVTELGTDLLKRGDGAGFVNIDHAALTVSYADARVAVRMVSASLAARTSRTMPDAAR